jgi:hypothetical protein
VERWYRGVTGFFLYPFLDASNSSCGLTRHESRAASGGLVVEENTYISGTW